MLYSDPVRATTPNEAFYYHTMDLPGLGLQRGQWDLRGRFADYVGHADVRDKRVLDVGTASGFLAFEAEQAGCREVVAFDMDTARRQHLLPFAGTSYVDDYEGWLVAQERYVRRWKVAFWEAHQAFRSKAKAHYGDVYAINPDIGTFDVTIVGSILEHLSNPIAALHSMAQRTTGLMVITTAIAEHNWPVALFAGRAAMPQNNYTWWAYSLPLYNEVLGMLGFDVIETPAAEFYCELDRQDHKLYSIVARRRQ